MAARLEDVEAELRKRGKLPQDNSQHNLSDIESELQRRGINIPQENKGWSGVGSDLLDKIKQQFALPSQEDQAALAQQTMQQGLQPPQIPEEFTGFGKQAFSMPYEAITGHVPRLTKNVYKGIENTLNLSSEIASYLGRKDIINPGIGEAIHIPEHDFDLGEKQPGDIIGQHLTDFLPLSPKGVKGFLASGKMNETALKHAFETVENTKKQHAEFLGEGQNFPKRLSDSFMDELRGEKNPATGRRQHGFMQAVGNRYNILSNKLKNEDVKIKSSPNTIELTKQIKQEYPQLNDKTQQQILEKWTKELSENKDVNAADFLKTYRSVKQQVNKLNDKYHTHGTSIKEQEELAPKIDSLKKQQQIMRRILDEQLGGHHLGELADIDKQYATLVAPLHENPIYQAFKKGKSPANVMQDISLDMPGNKTLRMILEKDPELQRLVVGQQFAKTPHNLAHPNETIAPYANMNPHIARIIEEAKHAKHLKENYIPELQKNIAKSQKRKLIRNSALGGAATVGGGLALEQAAGRDWKDDIPMLAAIKTMLKRHK